MEQAPERCRLCLDPIVEHIYSMKNAELKSKIDRIFPFELELKEGLPTSICSSCSNTILEFDLYVQKVRLNQEKLTAIDCKWSFEQIKIEPTEQFEPVICVEISQHELKSERSDEETIREEMAVLEHVPLEQPNKKKFRNKRICEKRKPIKIVSKTKEKKPKKIYNIKSKLEQEQDDVIIKEFYKLVCDICGEPATNFSTLLSHFRTVHNQPGYIKCCKRKIVKRCHLLQHMALHTNPESFRCEVCCKNFANKEYLKIHQAKAHGTEKDRPFKCNQCAQSFSREYLLRAHVVTHKKVQCPHCSKFLASKSVLNAHIVKVHSDLDRRMICDTCGREFLSQVCYEHHVKKHLGIKVVEEKLKCDVCDKWFIGKRGLQRHIRFMHYESEQTHICDVCNGQYPNSRALRIHKSTVHVEAAFGCEICGKKFKQAISLKEHRANHTGEALYSCDFCEAKMNYNGNLYSHLKKYHPVEWAAKKLQVLKTNEPKTKECPIVRHTPLTDITEEFLCLFVVGMLQVILQSSFPLQPALADLTLILLHRIDSQVLLDVTLKEKVFLWKIAAIVILNMETRSPGCRLCLEAVSENYCSIENAQLKEQLKTVFNFTVDFREGFPNNICEICSRTISEFYRFSKKVLQNQKQLTDKISDKSRLTSNNAAFEYVKIEPTEEVEPTECLELSLSTVEPKDQLPERDELSDDEESIAGELTDKSYEPLSDDSNEPLVKLKTKRFRPENDRSAHKQQEDKQIAEFYQMVCDLCAFMATNFPDLRAHFKKVHGRSAYVVCCKKKIPSKRSLLEHITVHKNPDVFQCEVCKKRYKTKESLTVHLGKSHGIGVERPYKCDQCLQSFPKQTTLDAHMEMHIKMQCPHCNQMVANKHCLRAHIKNKHSEIDRKMVCDTCGREFLNKLSFERHVMKHQGIEVLKKVQCQICQRWIKGERGLQLHMFNIHYEGVQTCDICQRQCPNTHALKRHKRIVHVEEKFECEFCNRKFKQAINLKEHRTIHTGEVLYSCKYCGKCTNSKANLYVHIKKNHPVQWAEKRLNAMESNECAA
ncbi:zinc finger protein 208-like [Topomyia yanbarensis]|uniref:zinc finger protein 208-like n=1 Tax=Topomyia yanbarensis TaxID=2498891 RepID=UPI00273CF24A|nr:zinc finger protein 208-like [Topomyia yanbarensis]